MYSAKIWCVGGKEAMLLRNRVKVFYRTSVYALERRCFSEMTQKLSMEELVQKSIDRQAQVENGTYNKPNSSPVPNVHQTMAGRRRFYKHVGFEEIPNTNGQYKVTLDGRTLKTPAMKPLQLPNKDLAFCIAAEWDAQTNVKKGLEPVSMPMMTLASTALDQIALDPETTINNCMRYLPTDSALFMTNDMDRILLLKQKQQYSPVVRWINRQMNTDLESTQSMSGRINHSEESVKKIRQALTNMDHFTLACLQSATYECKSLILALAYIGRYLTLDQVKAASRLEEEFQLEIWGVVEGGHDMDRLNNGVNLSSSGLFMSLYKSDEQVAEMVKSWNNL